MSKQVDPGVELLAELVRERLQEVRRELQEKVELAIRMAACSLSQELAVAAEQRHDRNGHAADEPAVAGR